MGIYHRGQLLSVKRGSGSAHEKGHLPVIESRRPEKTSGSQYATVGHTIICRAPVLFSSHRFTEHEVWRICGICKECCEDMAGRIHDTRRSRNCLIYFGDKQLYPKVNE